MIICAYTYTASASVVNHVGAKIVLVDCQPHSYLIDYLGYKCNMTDITAAVGLVQFDRYPGLLAKRRKINRVVLFDYTIIILGGAYMAEYAASKEPEWKPKTPIKAPVTDHDAIRVLLAKRKR